MTSDLDQLLELYELQRHSLGEKENIQFDSLKSKLEEQLEEYTKYKPIFDFCSDPDVLVAKVHKNKELEAQVKQLQERYDKLLAAILEDQS